jgi:4-hydroxy-tetrahydrodipicolinate reductase
MPEIAPVGTICVMGAAGRMGAAIIRNLAELPDLKLTAAIEHDESDKLGVDAAALAGAPTGTRGVPITTGTPAAGVAAVWIDFSSPEATAGHAAAAAAAGAALVVGTTGVSADGKQAVAEAARKIPVVFAPNTSVGVTVLLQLCAEAARLLGPGFDLEIVETHHRRKRDAPSGTALRLAEALAEATGRDLARDARTAREGDIGPRGAHEIGIQTVRGGDVVGDHTVFFLGDGERIEITHRASSRETFARGAVRAALWVAAGRAPGLYDMRDVLGLRAP